MWRPGGGTDVSVHWVCSCICFSPYSWLKRQTHNSISILNCCVILHIFSLSTLRATKPRKNSLYMKMYLANKHDSDSDSDKNRYMDEWFSICVILSSRSLMMTLSIWGNLKERNWLLLRVIRHATIGHIWERRYGLLVILYWCGPGYFTFAVTIWQFFCVPLHNQ